MHIFVILSDYDWDRYYMTPLYNISLSHRLLHAGYKDWHCRISYTFFRSPVNAALIDVFKFIKMTDICWTRPSFRKTSKGNMKRIYAFSQPLCRWRLLPINLHRRCFEVCGYSNGIQEMAWKKEFPKGINNVAVRRTGLPFVNVAIDKSSYFLKSLLTFGNYELLVLYRL